MGIRALPSRAACRIGAQHMLSGADMVVAHGLCGPGVLRDGADVPAEAGLSLGEGNSNSHDGSPRLSGGTIIA